MLTKEKGDLAVSHAIRYFISAGYEVCLPIGDRRPYDLIVEKKGVLKRVQVKYGGLYRGKTTCCVALRVMGGNQSYYSAKKYSDDDFDLLFSYTATGKQYLIPWRVISGKSSIHVECARYKRYSVN